MTVRYAIYYAPCPASGWQAWAQGWLQRNQALAAEPRRYGFHATLKAPFRPAPGVTQAQVISRTQQLAAALAPAALGPLQPVYMDGFVALVPREPKAAVNQLAQTCVTALDDLRAPLDAQDLARRKAHLLDERGRALMQQHGYPHVLERFRFHMTLTGRIDAPRAADVVAQLTPWVAALNKKELPVLDRICVFMEPAPDAPFVRLADASLHVTAEKTPHL